jgi:hypothetical protein
METLSALFVHLLLLSGRLLVLKASLVDVYVCVIVVDDDYLPATCKLLGLELVSNVVRCIWLRQHAAVQVVVLLVKILSLLVQRVVVQILEFLLARILLLLLDQTRH